MSPLGILMLDTRFPRIEGDIGNPASFDFPVIFRTMKGIGSADAVAAHPDRPRVLAALRANAEALAADGAVGLSTSCGFLALYQKELEAAVAGAGRDLRSVADQDVDGQEGRRSLRVCSEPRRRRISRRSRRRRTRRSKGLPPDGSFAATFLRNGLTLDRDAVERETIAAGKRIARRASPRRHHRARMHQPAALQSGPECGPRRAGVRRARPPARLSEASSADGLLKLLR